MPYDRCKLLFPGMVAGEVSLDWLSLFAPDLHAAGRVEVDTRIGGTSERPRLAGTLSLHGGRARWLGFPQGLEEVEFDLVLEEDRVELNRLHALFGGGEIVGSGEAQLDGLRLVDFRLEADVEQARLTWPEGFAGVYEGHIGIHGGPEESTLSGRLVMLRGLYDTEFDLATLFPCVAANCGENHDQTENQPQKGGGREAPASRATGAGRTAVAIGASREDLEKEGCQLQKA